MSPAATETVTTWTARIIREAEGLDLTDADDRATFRCRIATAIEGARVVVIADVARALGREPADRSRAAAARAMADAWIARSLGG